MQRPFIIIIGARIWKKKMLWGIFQKGWLFWFNFLTKKSVIPFFTWNHEMIRYLKNKVINLSESSKFKLRKKLKIIIPHDSSKSVTFLAPPEFCYRYWLPIWYHHQGKGKYPGQIHPGMFICKERWFILIINFFWRRFCLWHKVQWLVLIM